MIFVCQHLAEVDSTNAYLRRQKDATNIVVSADYQSSGRGQGSNTWESVRGANLLFSVKVSPSQVVASEQFVLSMAGALSVKAALDHYACGFTVKWPNDIFFGDRKISGTLIETTLLHKHVQDCIFGCGVNLNQQTFSSAPHAISLAQIVRHEVSRDEVLTLILQHFEQYYQTVLAGDYNAIYDSYHAALYRPPHDMYRDKNGLFTAQLLRVLPTGHLVLRARDGTLRRYETKELTFII